MSTVDHAALASELAARSNHFTYGDGADPITGHALAAEAQCHALLAIHEELRRIGNILEEAAPQ